MFYRAEATDNVDSNATKNLENANITIASMFIENERGKNFLYTFGNEAKKKCKLFICIYLDVYIADMEHENTDEGIILNEDWANPEEIFDFYVMSAEQLEMANQWVIGGF